MNTENTNIGSDPAGDGETPSDPAPENRPEPGLLELEEAIARLGYGPDNKPVRDLINLGYLLEKTREHIDHGRWETFVKNRLPMSPRLAWQYIHLYHRRGELADWDTDFGRALQSLRHRAASPDSPYDPGDEEGEGFEIAGYQRVQWHTVRWEPGAVGNAALRAAVATAGNLASKPRDKRRIQHRLIEAASALNRFAKVSGMSSAEIFSLLRDARWRPGGVMPHLADGTRVSWSEPNRPAVVAPQLQAALGRLEGKKAELRRCQQALVAFAKAANRFASSLIRGENSMGTLENLLGEPSNPN